MVDGMSRANGPKVKKRNVATKCILRPSPAIIIIRDGFQHIWEGSHLGLVDHQTPSPGLGYFADHAASFLDGSLFRPAQDSHHHPFSCQELELVHLRCHSIILPHLSSDSQSRQEHWNQSDCISWQSPAMKPIWIEPVFRCLLASPCQPSGCLWLHLPPMVHCPGAFTCLLLSPQRNIISSASAQTAKNWQAAPHCWHCIGANCTNQTSIHHWQTHQDDYHKEHLHRLWQHKAKTAGAPLSYSNNNT